jgi:hypothetical protein
VGCTSMCRPDPGYEHSLVIHSWVYFLIIMNWLINNFLDLFALIMFASQYVVMVSSFLV